MVYRKMLKALRTWIDRQLRDSPHSSAGSMDTPGGYQRVNTSLKCAMDIQGNDGRTYRFGRRREDGEQHLLPHRLDASLKTVCSGECRMYSGPVIILKYEGRGHAPMHPDGLFAWVCEERKMYRIFLHGCHGR